MPKSKMFNLHYCERYSAVLRWRWSLLLGGLIFFSFTLKSYSSGNNTNEEMSIKQTNNASDNNYLYGNQVLGFAMSIKLEKQEFTQSEPIEVTVRIKNVSQNSQSITIINEEKQYLFSVTDLSGKDIPKLDYQKKLETPIRIITRIFEEKMNSGTYKEYKFDLSIRYDLSKPGKYIVQCRRQVSQLNASTKKCSWDTVYSNKVEFTIK